MSELPKLIVVGGPTASGKTSTAVQLAKHFGTEVISADSRQFYRAIQIGTARPTEGELDGVPHHFLGHLELDQDWSAGAFATASEPVLQDILRKHGTAILVGGSGLYLDALIKGLDPLPTSTDRIRAALRSRLEADGMAPLLEELGIRDPITLERIDKNNPHRVIRALEVCIATGAPYSAQRTMPSDRKDIRIVRFAMDHPRAELYSRIDQRVDEMFRSGLVEEARAVLPYREHNALRTVGYRELFAHFDGDLSLAETITLIKQHSRNYAKRQMTWLRREPSWMFTRPSDIAQMVRSMTDRNS